MLDRYLEGLVKQASKPQRTLSDLDMDDLAKLAGFPLSRAACPKCGDAMTKVAGYLRCTCGVLKVAEEEPHEELAARLKQHVTGTPGTSDNLHLPKAGAPEAEKKSKCAAPQQIELSAPGGDVPLQVVHRSSVAPLTRGEAVGERKGRRVGALTGMGLGGAAGLAGVPYVVGKAQSAKEELLQKFKPQATRDAFIESYPKATRVPSKIAPQAAAKLEPRAAAMAERRLPELLQMLPKSRMGRLALAGGGALGAGALLSAVGGGAGRMAGGEIGQTIGGGVSPTIKEASATGMDLLSVGDAAGRILAKMAAAPEVEGVPVEELKESVEEAKAREDVPGRAKRWGIGGGIGGGLAGGAAGYGIGHLLTRGKTGVLPWAARLGGTAVGGAGGGALGAFLGHRHGAQEAQADQLLEAIRARQAFGTGAETGYQQGEQSGYMSALDELNQGGSPFQGR
jgi:hypothetical protein